MSSPLGFELPTPFRKLPLQRSRNSHGLSFFLRFSYSLSSCAAFPKIFCFQVRTWTVLLFEILCLPNVFSSLPRYGHDSFSSILWPFSFFLYSSCFCLELCHRGFSLELSGLACVLVLLLLRTTLHTLEMDVSPFSTYFGTAIPLD